MSKKLLRPFFSIWNPFAGTTKLPKTGDIDGLKKYNF